MSSIQWICNRSSGRFSIDLSHLKLIIYDEADELFQQDSNHPFFIKFFHGLEKKKVSPQHVLFSATYEPSVKDIIKKFFNQLLIYPLHKESLQLKGVRMLKLRLFEEEKPVLINMVYE